MTPRLYELHRVLKPTGSLYLHCDPSASHYLKIILDQIFQPHNFRNEVLWHYYNKMHDRRKKLFARATDTLLFYVKDTEEDFTFHQQSEKRDEPFKQLMRKKVGGKMINARDEHGKLMYQLKEDRTIDNVFRIPCLQPASHEFLPYPTQKPLALLRRILEASSNKGDVLLDPFCGCGTSIMAAQELGRKWIGIDITATATSLIEARLFDSFNIHNGPKGDFQVIGLPTTEFEAIDLANRDKHEFQKWAISLVPRAMPWQEKKGADGGVDGFVRFKFDAMEKGTGLVIISVKGGQNLKMDDIKNLGDTMEAQKAALGFLITLVPPTGPMLKWAQDKGMVKSPQGGTPVPKVQIRTVAQLLRGDAFAFPWNSTIHGIPRAGVGQGQLNLTGD